MDALATLNLNGYLCSNVRASFLAASQRWGVDYVEVVTPYRMDLNPCYTKPTLFARLFSYSRLAYFDADMLIRSDAPSPFAAMSTTSLSAVKDISESRFPPGSRVRDEIQNEAHRPWYRVLENHFKLGVKESLFIDGFFNAGFLLASPKYCERLFAFVKENIPREGSPYVLEGRYEQALINYAARAMGSVDLVDETWNYIAPDLSSGWMEKWVYHFTGINSAELKPRLGTFAWICRPEERFS